ncbi:Rab1a [Hexamita inflata]|uniref:Rab1a n=1 Tax=Hexamita inflata TaxID=28002 RepID=A0AA86UJM1_9EUKA|nr:Rab1a [Hexamita inflata]
MNEKLVKKLVIFGSSYTGKTYIASKFKEIQYNSYIETIGIDLNVVKFTTLPLLAHIPGKMLIFDTGYDFRDRSHSTHYRHAAIVLIVFSFSDMYSFQQCKVYAKKALYHSSYSKEKAQIFLIGNRFGVKKEVVSVDEAVDFAQFNNFQFFELNSSNFEQLKTLVQKNILKMFEFIKI